ncbi:PucR family transcriptional regulator [Rhizohabitans arisaemae]|uniref:PucR family transcriptional regulator n=1 Tax=Rhizohabitans arisaemae TaxID=2720610 RepID=UPI0024B1D55C|nr:PucR family transcriptional regulator [Rhizohabitans arisaemae]
MKIVDMPAELQRIVDDLAVRLNRPVLVEDRRQRVVAYSEQFGPMDDIRRNSILRRGTTPEIRAWLQGTGAFQSREPIRTPAAPHLGLLPRVCVPVRHRDLLLGFVWFIDTEPAMPQENVDHAVETISQMALALYHESLAAGLASHRELEAVRDLLLGDPRESVAAAHTLIEAGSFTQAGSVTALVIRPVLAPGAEPDESLRTAVEEMLLTARQAGRGALHLVRYDHGILLTAGTPQALQQTVASVVGVGRPQAQLAQAATSYGEALLAAQIAARVPSLGPTAEWATLGVYRLLASLPPVSPGDGRLHPGLERLLADEHCGPLVETLETYLDLAGNAHETARRLRLHRTSLYYRLHRVEELAGTDLKDGGERLALHLGLKLARLSGWPATGS